MNADMLIAAYAALFFVVYPVGIGAFVAHEAGGPLGLLVWAFTVLVCALAGWAYKRNA